MWNLHEMLVEDEILFCGLVLFAGVISGVLARWLVGQKERKVPQ
jgi:hypothetical protein